MENADIEISDLQKKIKEVFPKYTINNSRESIKNAVFDISLQMQSRYSMCSYKIARINYEKEKDLELLYKKITTFLSVKGGNKHLITDEDKLKDESIEISDSELLDIIETNIEMCNGLNEFKRFEKQFIKYESIIHCVIQARESILFAKKKSGLIF